MTRDRNRAIRRCAEKLLEGAAPRRSGVGSDSAEVDASIAERRNHRI